MKQPLAFWPFLMGLSLIFTGCKDEPVSSKQEKTSSEIEITALKYPPVSTFEQSCARCHGPQGSFFGKKFAQENDKDLIQTVQDMMEGPSFLQPTPPDIAAMTAYLQAIVAQTPYLCVTAWDAQSAHLQGQATPLAEVTAVGCDDKRVTADPQGQWQLADLPDNWQGELQADWQGKTTRLSLQP